MNQRRPKRGARRRGLGALALDYDVNLTPVPVDIPDVSYIPGLDTPTAGVSTDDSGMSVVTVVGSQAPTLPWWFWPVMGIVAAEVFRRVR